MRSVIARGQPPISNRRGVGPSDRLKGNPERRATPIGVQIRKLSKVLLDQDESRVKREIGGRFWVAFYIPPVAELVLIASLLMMGAVR
jgi:hypothetical protein